MTDTASVLEPLDSIEPIDYRVKVVEKIDSFLDDIRFVNLVKASDVQDFALDLRLLVT